MRRRGPVPICDVRPPLSTRPLGTRLPLEHLASHLRPNTFAVYWTERAGTDLSGNLSRPDGRIVTAIPRFPLSRSLGRDALEPGFHGGRTPWNRGFMAFWCYPEGATRAGRAWRPGPRRRCGSARRAWRA